MDAVEIEVKFRVASISALTQQLLLLGFEVQTARTFEHNVLFDTADHSLRAARSILRVRHYGGRCILTHKCLPQNHDPQERLKHRQETETIVEDGDALCVMLHRLGYIEAFAYEKWRTELTDGTGHCVIDETPIGMFAELEGPEAWIDAQTSALGLASSELLTLSYGRLFEAWKAETGSAAEQLTFAECMPVARDMQPPQ